MGNLIALFFVIFAIVLGIGACWAIAASGASADTPTDTFGNTPPADTVQHNADSSGLAIATMPVLLIAFFVMVCVILVAGFVWFWRVGTTKISGY